VSTEHLCRNHPKGKRWEPGTAASCPHHRPANRKSLSYREGKTFRRKRDREAGVVGVERGGVIHG
jgi:hypothetical protein